MRHLIPIVAVAASTMSLSAQWTTDPQVNTTVRASVGLEAITPLMCDGPSGSTYVSWFEGTSGGFQLRMQRLDRDGLPLWGGTGLLVSDEPQSTALFRYDLAADLEGNAIVAFQDLRTGEMRPAVCKVAPDGQLLWGNGVTLLDGLGGTGLAPTIGVLADNTIVLAWNGDNGDNGYIPMVALDPEGMPVWTTPVILGNASTLSRPQVLSTSDGGFWVLCVQETGNFPFTNTLYAYRFNSEGVEQLQLPVSTRTTSVFYFPAPVPDGHDGFYVAFNTGNPGNPALTDVYLQRVRADGSLWNSAGAQLLSGTSTQRYGGPLALVSDDDGLLAPLQVTNIAQSAGGLQVQRVDTAGSVLLVPDGVEVVASSTGLPNPSGIAALPNGAIITYASGGFGAVQLEATAVGLSGEALWTPASIPMCTVNSGKDDAACGAVVDDLLVLVWHDDRTASGIYAQSITSSGALIATAVPLEGTIAAIGLQVVQDGGASWLQGMGSPVSGDALLRVFDATGRLEHAIRARWSEGAQRVLLPTLMAGMHVVELTTEGRTQQVRFVVN